jgi:AhpD family alkylhydroperoxidase
MTTVDPADAPGNSQELLKPIIERHGSAGAMVATMAHSPALLQGYLDLSWAMKRVKLPRTLSEKISLALQEWLGCSVCLAAHTDAGRRAGLNETDITLAKQGSATDLREAALIAFAMRVLAEPASISDQDVAALRGLGWDDRILADTVGLVALNHMTGSFNLVAGLEAQSTGPTHADKENRNHVA